MEELSSAEDYIKTSGGRVSDKLYWDNDEAWTLLKPSVIWDATLLSKSAPFHNTQKYNINKDIELVYLALLLTCLRLAVVGLGDKLVILLTIVNKYWFSLYWFDALTPKKEPERDWQTIFI